MRAPIFTAILPALILLACPAAAAAAEGPIVRLDGKAGGPRFDGIGVVEGGGGTGVLLKDYPEPQRSQILDLMFTPKFGASVSALYVEIPGDGNATQGSMPSHQHSRDDLDYRRGYMWWEMTEARRRNPALTLDGAAWSAPGWIGTKNMVYPQNTGAAYASDRNFYSDDMADYYVAWLKGLRDVYGLQLDAIGSRNEKGASYDFAKAFRRKLDANGFAKVKLHGFDNWPDGWKFDFVKDMASDADLKRSIDIVSAHINEPVSTVPTDVQQAVAAMGKPLWNTEQHVYKAGYDGLIGIVEAFNKNYAHSGVTKIVNWYGIAALYTMESYSGTKEAALRANWPWSGHYEINPSLWAYAHYGQFSAAGWHYLKGGSGDLGGGGTYVTLQSPGADDSIIVETSGAKAAQTIRFATGGGLSKAALAVWRSNAAEQFVRQPDIAPRGGVVAVTLEPNAVYSLTTTRGQQKGSFGEVPAVQPFPFPYRETFDGYPDRKQWGSLPGYFADISGAFELAACPVGTGGCLRQMAPVPTLSWAPDWQPYTIIGDDRWRDYEVSADIYLHPGESAGVMGRITDVGTGYGFIPKGYILQLDAAGQLRLTVVRGKADKKKLVGDAEQQALIRAQNDASEGGEKLLASAQLPATAAGAWHRLTMRFDGTRIAGLLDGTQRLAASDGLYASGMAGLLAGRVGDRLSMPYYDDFVVKQAGAPAPDARSAQSGGGAGYIRPDKASVRLVVRRSASVAHFLAFPSSAHMT